MARAQTNTDMELRVMRRLCCPAVAVLLACLTACGGDHSDDYLIDIDRVAEAVVGAWNITDITVKLAEGEDVSIDEQLLDATVSFDGGQFATTSKDNKPLYGGTYNIRRFYIALQRDGGKKDTLQLKRYDSDTYRTFVWSYRHKGGSTTDYTLEKK